MTTVVNLPSPALPLAGPDGRISPVWFQFFVTLFMRTGSTLGAPASDLVVDAAESGDTGVADVLAQLYILRDNAHLAPPQLPGAAPEDPHARIEALEALMQRLQSEIEAIRQGQQL